MQDKHKNVLKEDNARKEISFRNKQGVALSTVLVVVVYNANIFVTISSTKLKIDF